MDAAWELIEGDAGEVLRGMSECSIDAVVTDPPAGIGFMGKAWDGDKGGRDQWIAWLAGIMGECLRVLKPGGHALVWSLPRTSHWTGTAVEHAGFEVRDVVSHWFGSGFPKSLDVAKAMDKQAGHWRGKAGAVKSGNGSMSAGNYERTAKGGPVTAAAAAAAGWGTALKPACEFWWMARKPLDGTVAGNVAKWGTGAISVDGCRVRFASEGDKAAAAAAQRLCQDQNANRTAYGRFENGPASLDPYLAKMDAGRWPAHLVLTHAAGCFGDVCAEGCPVLELDRQSGESTSTDRPRHNSPAGYQGTIADIGARAATAHTSSGHADAGGASRYFAQFRYTPKATTHEKDSGLDTLPVHSPADLTGRQADAPGTISARSGGGPRSGKRNVHPTVKPISLMRWLCRLITPPGGMVLDPFAGSGTTLVAALQEGFRVVGIERQSEYVRIARMRIEEDMPLFSRVTR